MKRCEDEKRFCFHVKHGLGNAAETTDATRSSTQLRWAVALATWTELSAADQGFCLNSMKLSGVEYEAKETERRIEADIFFTNTP